MTAAYGNILLVRIESLYLQGFRPRLLMPSIGNFYIFS